MAWRLDKVVSSFTEAATDPTKWDVAMDVVATEAGARGAVLLPVQGRLPFLPVADAIRETADRYVREGWIEKDRRYEAVPAMMIKAVATDLDFMSSEQMLKSEYYQDFLAPSKLQWAAMVRVVAGDDHWLVSIQRTIAQGPFQSEELSRLAQLSSMLDPATSLARALGFARAEGALNAFELSSTAALMLNSSGAVIKLNESARKLLGEYITVRNGRLRTRSAAVSSALDKAIFQVIWKADHTVAPAIAIPREFGRPIVAYVLRAGSVAMEMLSPSRAFVLLIDPDINIAPAINDLQKLFGLTQSESKLVAELQRQKSLTDAASKLNISYENARTTLKQAFRKTDTSGQVELMGLISKLRAK